MAKVKATAKEKRKRRLFFNKEARHSAAEALKQASWMIAALTGGVGLLKGSVVYAVVVALGWVTCQAVATLILSVEEEPERGDTSLPSNPTLKSLS